jgi:hypothetical protein
MTTTLLVGSCKGEPTHTAEAAWHQSAKTGWTGFPALDLLSPHSHVLPQRAGKAAHRGRDITPPLQIDARTIEKIGFLDLIASKKII